MLGRVLMGARHWRVEAMGKERLAKLRERFEAAMGETVSFAGERRDDIGARMKAEEPAYDAALAPPSLLELPMQLVASVSRVRISDASGSPEEALAQRIQRQDREFFDAEIPMLEGKTPRQAAAIPALRPRLLTLMKLRVRECDERNLMEGGAEDVNWMIRELGLTEILFEPPPTRPRLRVESLSDEGGAAAGNAADLKEPPRLPAEPLTEQEAGMRLDAALGAFPSMIKALEYLGDMGYPLFEDLSAVLDGLLKDREQQFLLPLVAMAVLCFAPRGTRPPEVPRDHLRSVLAGDLQALQARLGTAPPERTMDFLCGGSQPALMRFLVGMCVEVIERAPENVRPASANSRFLMLVAIKAVVDALDQSMREGL